MNPKSTFVKEQAADSAMIIIIVHGSYVHYLIIITQSS